LCCSPSPTYTTMAPANDVQMRSMRTIREVHL
jgi:hypothetical protein